MSSPLVSVIIPNYCHAQFLEERIQSVLQQTYQDFELIIMDDCSPDGGASREVIERYRHDPHVSQIVYNDVNSGSAFQQWHKGMELARGEYIWLAESDDSCDHRLLERLVGRLEATEAVMAFCRSVKYDEHGEKSHYAWQDCLRGDFVVDGATFTREYLATQNRVANASSVVFRRVEALSVDSRYLQLRGEGDWMFWILLAERGLVCFVNEELNYFRFHEENFTMKSVTTGTAYSNHRHVYDYLVEMGYLTGRKKHKVRMSCAHASTSLSIDKGKRDELLHQWDPYHIYRTLYFLLHTKGRMVEWIRQKGKR